MDDPWEKAYVYGLYWRQSSVAHITTHQYSLCSPYHNSGTLRLHYFNRSPKPYPVCKNCLKTRRAKELGL
ncbi:hypothetical protein LCGC14_0989860 [marine sediment metagenome]|uniref:Uncharacterized protein n=1 Tax=marine sediment metagenome TaxID=412755 RepID=A0A0F9RCP9_9ZZZZ